MRDTACLFEGWDAKSTGMSAVSWNVEAIHPAGNTNAANGQFGFVLEGAVPDRIFRDGFESQKLMPEPAIDVGSDSEFGG
jgi:hypothetical protein